MILSQYAGFYFIEKLFLFEDRHNDTLQMLQVINKS